MPELPEVETVVRGLRQTIVGETIERVHLNNTPPSTIVVGDSFKSDGFTRALAGRKILDITRRGKNILINLSGDITLWAHLKMTGHFFYRDKSLPLDKHDLVIFDFRSAKKSRDGLNLRFHDYRRFGRLRLFSNNELWEQDGLKALGPEPLTLSVDNFVSLCADKSRMIKPALLDQTFIAGLGNIYTDETLYLARLHPKRLISSVSRRKLVELHGHIRDILKFAIRKMGTSVDSFSSVNGQAGQFQKYLKAYGNEGKPCERCGAKIVREKIGSRSAHFCPRCQRV